MTVKFDDRKKLIGERIKKERKTLKLSKKEFCLKIYLSEQSVKTVTAWENGDRLPDLESIARMADLFHCQIGYLLGDFNSRTREIADVREIIGLSEFAIQSLISYTDISKRKESLKSGFPLDIANAYGAQHLEFYSEFICSAAILGMLNSSAVELTAIKRGNISKAHEEVFGDEMSAIRFYKFEMIETLSKFIEDYFSKQDLLLMEKQGIKKLGRPENG